MITMGSEVRVHIAQRKQENRAKSMKKDKNSVNITPNSRVETLLTFAILLLR